MPAPAVSDFFAAQDEARARTRRLLVLFTLAVICIVLGVYCAVATGYVVAGEWLEHKRVPFWELERFLSTAGLTCALVGGSSLVRITQLRQQGGGGVCRSMGGRRIDPTTRNPAERRLLNVVEEMAIAAGTAVPEVYVLERERGLNAFAAGFTTEDACIAVTAGLLDQLSRDELQGVVAHEFSHIVNGDMRMNTRLAGWIHGILLLTVFGRSLWEIIQAFEGDDGWIAPRYGMGSGRSGRSGGGGGGGVLVLILIVIIVIVLITIIGFIGEAFARMIQGAVSRQREYLADAAAVQFTRHPEGLANALRRLGGRDPVSDLRTPRAPGFAHALFAPASRRLEGLQATHPPLRQRIRRIFPQWDGTFILPAAAVAATAEAIRPPPLPDAAQRLVLQTGRMRSAGRDYALHVRASIDRELRQALEDPMHAAGALLAALFSHDPDVARHQQRVLDNVGSPEWALRAREYREPVDRLGRDKLLPLLELAAPRVASALGAHDRTLFLQTMDRLIDADGQVAIFELLLRRIVRRRLGEPIPMHLTMSVHNAAGTVFMALATIGARRQDAAQRVVDNAAAPARGLQGKLPTLVPPPTMDQLDVALDVLAVATLRDKQEILETCERIVAHDGVSETEELELMRAVAASMGIPMPPVPGNKRIPSGQTMLNSEG